jgi:hypothetical protein
MHQGQCLSGRRRRASNAHLCRVQEHIGIQVVFQLLVHQAFLTKLEQWRQPAEKLERT